MSDDTMQRAFKRRRFQPDTTMDNAESGNDYPPFMNMALARSKGMFPNNNGESRPLLKRVISCTARDLRSVAGRP